MIVFVYWVFPVPHEVPDSDDEDESAVVLVSWCRRASRIPQSTEKTVANWDL